ncbi:MAG: hypothetical protein V4671_20015 [Armatimonadota bacterium]
MTLTDDEILAEEALKETSNISDPEERAASFPAGPASPAVPLESGMDTGQGADDEPELAIGDRHVADAEHVSPDEARRLLGGEDG